MLRRIQNFCRTTLSGQLNRNADAAGLQAAPPAEESFKCLDWQLQNTLRAIVGIQ
ncbi:hypothetical protein ZHAS_00003403 [Anopheles sinensis]|uniref:Uncharacterized protein n=1 Tax=Anopheles sinensis TaxID=74873 RepID=A0A084VE89_ANOSI|nr:hypothetical protein ZHAS_00003403 [Anopheles sinensis]